VQQPRKRDLPRHDAFPLSHFTHGRSGAHVGVKVLSLISRIVAPEVTRGILLGALYHAGEKSATERRERDKTDPELTQQRHDARLEIALP
jgi:hypothetical protein